MIKKTILTKGDSNNKHEFRFGAVSSTLELVNVLNLFCTFQINEPYRDYGKTLSRDYTGCLEGSVMPPELNRMLRHKWSCVYVRRRHNGSVL